MKMQITRILGLSILAAVAIAAIAAPVLAPNDADARFRNLLYAPPTWPHVWHQFPTAGPRSQESSLRRPFVYPWLLVSRLEQRYEQDRSRAVSLTWFSGGKLIRSSMTSAPLMLFGADSFGRDVFGRLLYGARTSLALAVTATIGALLIGALIGAIAGMAGSNIDDFLMRLAELMIVLPTVYVVLVLRAALPLVLAPRVVFGLLAAIFALVGWPFVARGVRGIVASEKRREYAVGAQSLGAGRARLLFRHLLPACSGFIAVQATLLVPAFIVAEATLSYVGLGFSDPVASWGSMLRDASDIVAITEFPWTLAPAGAIFIVVLGFNLIVQSPVPAMGAREAAKSRSPIRNP
jgi:peptide/nickel transport system permease protein